MDQNQINLHWVHRAAMLRASSLPDTLVKADLRSCVALMWFAHRAAAGRRMDEFSEKLRSSPHGMWILDSEYHYRNVHNYAHWLCNEWALRFPERSGYDYVVKQVLDRAPAELTEAPFREPPVIVPEACYRSDIEGSYRALVLTMPADELLWTGRLKPAWASEERLVWDNRPIGPKD